MLGIAEAALVSATHCGVVQTRDAPMSPPQSDLVNSDGLQSNHAPTEDIVVSAVLFDVCDTACCALARRWAKTDARQSRSPSKLFEADVQSSVPDTDVGLNCRKCKSTSCASASPQ